MKQERYEPLLASADVLKFKFNSIGPKGRKKGRIIMVLLLKEKLIEFVNMKVKKKLKKDWASGVRVIRDKSLDKLSDVDWFPEKTKEANKVVANLKWKV